jgi:mono/diheme cytochrome c family protein
MFLASHKHNINENQDLYSNTRILLLALLVIFTNTAATQEAFSQNKIGAEVYLQARCYACHGNDGGGTLGPALAGDRVLSIPTYVISQILIGRGEMPAFADKLTDQQIAAVAEYIRNSWGNHFGPVKPEDVAQARKQLRQSAEQTAAPQRPFPVTPQ